MTTHLQTFRLVRDADFRARVQVAAFKIAQDVLNDGDPDQAGPRYTLARQAFRLDDPVVDKFAWACATNPTIAAAEATSPNSSADSDLDFVVASVWDKVATS